MGGPSRAAPVRVPRFHVPTAAPGARVLLPDHAAHHARQVLRLRAGAAVRVFDGQGQEFEALLDVVAREGVQVRLGARVAPLPESGLRAVVCLPPLPGDRMELVIQKATELGAAEIWPVITARTEAVVRPALGGSRQDRWNKVASGAAEQCGRAVVPRIAPTTTLDKLIEEPFEGRRFVLLERKEEPPLSSVSPPPTAVLLLVGPAGGFEPSEAARLLGAGFTAAGLGPRIVRAETAALAALVTAQALWGDLG